MKNILSLDLWYRYHNCESGSLLILKGCQRDLCKKKKHVQLRIAISGKQLWPQLSPQHRGILATLRILLINFEELKA